ncbi:MAG TPA: CaiB/BaiF CoA-transferase family protein [Dehalococcoidia bacterium]|nr:CaiB/BaiF CoA-transferase family protein [Dehalococcoidia bacterium]
MPGPLAGIKILDLSRLAPGPYGVMLLGDMGADVIRIEEAGPPTGRRAEQQGDAAAQKVRDERDSAFLPHNRNKRSLCLDLKSPEGLEVFYDLVRRSDVLLEEFRPNVKYRLKIDYETLSALNPRLIYCSLTGYGQDGPYRDVVGHDINYISHASALSMVGQKGGPPAIPSNWMADMAGGGMHAALGIMFALFAREKTGRGQYVDIAMLDGVVSLLEMNVSEYFQKGDKNVRGEAMNNGGSPWYNAYQCADGKWLSIGPFEPWFWANLCRALGREDLAPHQWNREMWPDIFDIFRATFRTKPRDEWYDLLNQTDICVGRVYEVDEMVEDPQILARSMVVEVDHPSLGKVPQVGIPMKLSDTPGEIRFAGVTPGFHTDEILGELGLAKERIGALRAQGIVR